MVEAKMSAEAIFVEAIREERDALNSRVAARRLAVVQLDGEALLEHLRVAVEPIVRAVYAVFPERARGVIAPLFDASLDLMAASLLGPQAKSPHVDQVWREVLPGAAKLLAREPLRVAGFLSNAAAFLPPGLRKAELGFAKQEICDWMYKQFWQFGECRKRELGKKWEDARKCAVSLHSGC